MDKHACCDEQQHQEGEGHASHTYGDHKLPIIPHGLLLIVRGGCIRREVAAKIMVTPSHMSSPEVAIYNITITVVIIIVIQLLLSYILKLLHFSIRVAAFFLLELLHFFYSFFVNHK